jgi:glycosyltransferase involved in cell wall biosynthesis
MNVMLVTQFDPPFGGVAAVVGNLARHLEQRGHRVVFFAWGAPERPTRRTTAWGMAGYEQNLRPPLNPERRVRSRIAFLLLLVRTLWRLGAVIRAERIDIVNIHYPQDEYLYFLLLRLVLRFKLVVSVHGADLFPNGEPLPAYPWTLKRLLQVADAVVAPSHSFLQDCVATFPVVARNGLAIHNGIDLEEFPEATDRRDIRPAGGEEYLLCIAAHRTKKAIDVLLRAFVAIRRHHPAIRLRLVGDGPMRRALEQLARDLSIAHKVDFLGARGRAEVAKELEGCAVFVLPSRAEPFGIVVVEALVRRRPVVASAAGGIPEIIEDGHSGILVTPDDPNALAAALLRVLGDKALSESIARQGEVRARAMFGKTMMGSRYEGLYESLRRNPQPDGPHPAGTTSRRVGSHVA